MLQSLLYIGQATANFRPCFDFMEADHGAEATASGSWKLVYADLQSASAPLRLRGAKSALQQDASSLSAKAVLAVTKCVARSCVDEESTASLRRSMTNV